MSMSGAASGNEVFEICDDLGAVIGQALRKEVHKRGLLHRSVHVLAFDDAGRLWMQRRAEDKDVEPGLWDISVGEHLQVGEGFHQAAVRGFAEELGVTGADVERVREMHRALRTYPEVGKTDNELQETWIVTHPVDAKPDPVEIAELRPVPVSDALAMLDAGLDGVGVTSWCRDELTVLRGVLPDLAARCAASGSKSDK